MSDYLMRDDAPLTAEEWARVDELVVSAARRMLAGRRFIHLAGPFGAGAQVVPLDALAVTAACVHSTGCCNGGCEEDTCDTIQVAGRQFVPLTLIHKDFVLDWRDIEAAHQHGAALDLGPAAAAATAVAQAEDALIVEALLSAEGRQTVPIADWKTAGNAMENVADAIQTLAGAGFYPPYTLLVGPALYALLQRPYPASGELEYELVEDAVGGGVLMTPALKPQRALLVAQGPQYMDIAIGQDMITAYLGPAGMDHCFRVLESLAVRVKQGGAICVMG